jgi:AcrR family transcriptional regulator
MPRKKAEKKSAPYHAHRERQRRRILDAAWALFDERGIDRVTMAEIVAGSELRASTMYQYFANKDEIVWDLLREVMTEAAGEAQRRIEGAQDALGRLSALFEFMADELSRRPVRARFMAQFDALYAHDWPAERLLSLESQINPQGFQYFSDLVREGIADGSLRPDLDPDLTMHAVMNAVIGSQRRLASLGSKVEIEYGKPVDQLFRETIRILLLGLRAPAPSAGTPAPKRTKARTSNRKRSS